MNYRNGLASIKKLASEKPWQQKFLVLEASLLENIESEELFGTSQQIRSDRARIILQLNKLAMDNIGKSFNDFCEDGKSETLGQSKGYKTDSINTQIIINTEGGNYYAGPVNVFASLLSEIDKRSSLDNVQKEEIKSEINALSSETSKKAPNETFFAQRISNIKKMAPDIADVVLATIINPAAGFSEVARKIAQKIKD